MTLDKKLFRGQLIFPTGNYVHETWLFNGQAFTGYNHYTESQRKESRGNFRGEEQLKYIHGNVSQYEVCIMKVFFLITLGLGPLHITGLRSPLLSFSTHFSSNLG